MIYFQLYSMNHQLDENVDLQGIAASCNGYVGADLKALSREAARFAHHRFLDTGKFILKMEDWEHARKEVGPSITRGISKEVSKVSWDDIGGLNLLKVRSFDALSTHTLTDHFGLVNCLCVYNRKSSSRQLNGLLSMQIHSQD